MLANKFRKEFDLTRLVGIRLKIGDLEVLIVKLYDETEMTIILKFFWLPLGLGKSEIANFLNEKNINQAVIKKIEFEQTLSHGVRGYSR